MHPTNKALLGYVSAALVSGACLWEGTRYEAYYDGGGVPTVCTGRTKDVVFGKKYSKEECHKYLVEELAEYGKGVLECVTAPLQQHEYDAFTLMAYNVGVKGFCGSRAVKLFNAGNVLASCRAMAYGPNNEPVWSYDNGKYIQGLHNRRKYEMRMCLGEMNVQP